MLPDMSSVITGGSVIAIATRTLSNWSRLHFITVVLPSDFTSLIAALSAAIDPKRSAKRFDIALTISLD